MDMKSLMRQAQEMQKKMQKAQEELANLEFEGMAGAGMVKVTMLGNGMVKKVFVDDSLVKQDEKEILEDLLVAAFNDAKNKADEGSSDSMKSVTSGIALPPGFKI
ncbi:MAG: YbaB/EbfC family nucleoid-associated protein [Rickettsiales bacterium]|nr:YbaB/EbfC family nucleoid-associated protein [Rickettsiales bacterium]